MLRPQTHTIATAKQSCVCIYSYENAQKLLPPELLLLAQICTKSCVGWGDPTGGSYGAPPNPFAGLGDGAPGKEKEGVEGKGVRGREQGLF